MKQVMVITGTVPSDCISIQLMTEVKWSQSSGRGPRGMLRRVPSRIATLRVVGKPEIESFAFRRKTLSDA
jgi:hypothetical protein